MEWISVKDRLPNKEESKNPLIMAVYHNGEWKYQLGLYTSQLGFVNYPTIEMTYAEYWAIPIPPKQQENE